VAVVEFTLINTDRQPDRFKTRNYGNKYALKLTITK